MTRRLAFMTVLLVGGTALVMLLVALAFVPVDAWERFVPLATIVGGLGVLLAGVSVELVGERLIRPARRLLHAIEDEELGDQTVHMLVRQAPSEVAPLLYGLHITQTRLRRTFRQLQQERTEVSTIFEHMADSVLVLDNQERVVMSNPAAERMLRYPAPIGHRLVEVVRDAELVDLARSATSEGTQVRAIELHTIDPGDFGEGSEPRTERRYIQGVATLLPEERRLVVLQDLSELRRAEVARRDFVANLSHEL
ncbi:MAG TPA: PAS domain-containing protein, partial [Chloroflexota bacterium]